MNKYIVLSAAALVISLTFGCQNCGYKTAHSSRYQTLVGTTRLASPQTNCRYNTCNAYNTCSVYNSCSACNNPNTCSTQPLANNGQYCVSKRILSTVCRRERLRKRQFTGWNSAADGSNRSAASLAQRYRRRTAVRQLIREPGICGGCVGSERSCVWFARSSVCFSASVSKLFPQSGKRSRIGVGDA